LAHTPCRSWRFANDAGGVIDLQYVCPFPGFLK
jgi:hypothetical protein